MNTVLCLLSMLVTFMGVSAASQTIHKDVAKSQMKTPTDNAENGNLNSLNKNADVNPDLNAEDTEISDTKNDIKSFFSMKEKEILKRLSDIGKSLNDKENEQLSEEGDVQNESTTESNGSKIIDSDIDSNVESESDTQNSETQSEGNVTDDIAENNTNSESITDAKVNNRMKSEIQNSEINSKESISNSSENIDNSKSEKLYSEIENENSITDLDISESDASDTDIDNYYNELLNSDLVDTELFTDFIGDDEDAYSVVDITLPRDTQFEMVKYEKMQNGRKVVLMKLVPVGSTVAESDDDEQSGNNKNEVIIPIKDTNTVQEDTTINGDVINNNDKRPTRGVNKNLISVDTDESTSDKSEVTDDAKDNSETVTLSDDEVISDDAIMAEDVPIEDYGNKYTEKSNIVEDNNNKSATANEDNAKWCICYEKLTDIPWVVRMQMGI